MIMLRRAHALLLIPLSSLGGAQAVKLNQELATYPFGDAVDLRVSPDGSHVAYLADQEFDERFELWAKEIGTAAAPFRVNGAMIAEGDVGTFGSLSPFEFTPDGGHVIYVADQETDELRELYSRALGAGSPVKLSLPAHGQAVAFEVTPDSNHVFYSAGGDLYAAPVDGSMPAVFISTIGSLPVVTADSLFAYTYSNTGRSVVRYSVGGGAPTTITPPIPTNTPDETYHIAGFFLTASESRIVYRIVETILSTCGHGGCLEHTTLHSVAIDGTNPLLLDDQLNSFQGYFLAAPSSDDVLYHKLGVGLQSVNAGGGVPVLLETGFPGNIQFSPDFQPRHLSPRRSTLLGALGWKHRSGRIECTPRGRSPLPHPDARQHARSLLGGSGRLGPSRAVQRAQRRLASACSPERTAHGQRRYPLLRDRSGFHFRRRSRATHGNPAAAEGADRR